MSFIKNLSNPQQQQTQPSVVSITSTLLSRRGSNNNNDTTNNISSGEWTARTETYDSYNDPFGDQISNNNFQQQQNDYDEQQQQQQQPPPLIDPFDNNNCHTRTIIRKLGLKRNSQSNGTIDSKVSLVFFFSSNRNTLKASFLFLKMIYLFFLFVFVM